MVSFPISDFKNYLSTDILEKGEACFKSNHISNLKQKGSTWEASIQGTDTYSVIVYTRDGEISGWDCTCPYNHGPVCKHVAAVFYALQKQTK